jgi:hypothetical protein
MRAVVGKGKIYANHMIYRELGLRMGFACLVSIDLPSSLGFDGKAGRGKGERLA